MEVLSGMFQHHIIGSGFRFHWRCDRLRIVNLCFVDDLFVFCRGDVESVSVVRATLSAFHELSGLAPSPAKSSVFFLGVQPAVKGAITEILGFAEGTLPVRYLGVPLITTRLTYGDYRPLLNRILARVRSWTCRFLSYAGHAQLVRSVLFALQVYWASIFILPKRVLREIEFIMRSFLWQGVEMKPVGAKVAWDQVCLPRREGGLGFVSLIRWNRVAMAKHVWFLCTGDQSSLWCLWVRTHLIGERSFWEIRPPSAASWIWKKLLGLREELRGFIRYEIGDGMSTFLWWDWWHPSGPICTQRGERVVYDSGLGREARVASIIHEGSWRWPIVRSIDLIELSVGLTPDVSPKPGLPDSVRWVLDRSGSSSLWQAVRPCVAEVEWHSVVWFPGQIPQFGFITWLAILGRLSTGDRLLAMGISVTQECSLCPCTVETHDHLFFYCPFSGEVWRSVLRLCGVSWRMRHWATWLSFLSRMTRGKSMSADILRLCFSTTVYMLWKERNSRRFDRPLSRWERVYDEIVSTIHCRFSVSSGRHVDRESIKIATRWQFHDT
ncbi:hypothetical protein Dimus_038873 [Dionaea muscipula]